MTHLKTLLALSLVLTLSPTAKSFAQIVTPAAIHPVLAGDGSGPPLPPPPGDGGY